MKYISVGAVVTAGTEHIIHVTRGGHSFKLTGIQASLWLNGRLKFAETTNRVEMKALEHLDRMGLVVFTDGSAAEEYRALTRCTIVPAEMKHPYWFLHTQEQLVLKWIREAGLVLSMAELVFLLDRNIEPTPNLLGNNNVQALVERIYTKETISDNILENHMEKVRAKEATVKTVLRLLAKKRIVLM